MPIICVEIMKTIGEREKCDASCVVMGWRNSEVYFKQ